MGGPSYRIDPADAAALNRLINVLMDALETALPDCGVGLLLVLPTDGHEVVWTSNRKAGVTPTSLRDLADGLERSAREGMH